MQHLTRNQHMSEHIIHVQGTLPCVLIMSYQRMPHEIQPPLHIQPQTKVPPPGMSALSLDNPHLPVSRSSMCVTERVCLILCFVSLSDSRLVLVDGGGGVAAGGITLSLGDAH